RRTVDGLQWSGGGVSGAGAADVVAGGVLAINGVHDMTQDTRTLSNAGSGAWGGSGRLIAANGALIDNLSGATFTIHAGPSLVSVGNVGSFRNAGALILDAANSTVPMGIRLQTSGQVHVMAGRLRPDTRGRRSGSFAVGSR